MTAVTAVTLVSTIVSSLGTSITAAECICEYKIPVKLAILSRIYLTFYTHHLSKLCCYSHTHFEIPILP